MESIKEIINLEEEIENAVMDDNGCKVHFDYTKKNNDFVNNYHLNVTTYNKENDVIFLMTSVTGESKIECLNKTKEYVLSNSNKGSKKSEKNYTIIWGKVNQPGMNTSYFSASSPKNALEKFYHNNDEKTLILFKLILNPES